MPAYLLLRHSSPICLESLNQMGGFMVALVKVSGLEMKKWWLITFPGLLGVRGNKRIPLIAV